MLICIKKMYWSLNDVVLNISFALTLKRIRRSVHVVSQLIFSMIIIITMNTVARKHQDEKRATKKKRSRADSISSPKPGRSRNFRSFFGPKNNWIAKCYDTTKFSLYAHIKGILVDPQRILQCV